jgi:hypothetical protein
VCLAPFVSVFPSDKRNVSETGMCEFFSNDFLPTITQHRYVVHLSLADTNILTTTAVTRALTTGTNTSSTITEASAGCRGIRQPNETT